MEAKPGRGRGPFRTALGGAVLIVSGLGFPLTQVVIARCGRRGAVVAEGVAVGLLARDVALVRMGAFERLRPLPAWLLRMELGAALLAAATGLAAVARPRQRLEPSAAGAIECVRRFAVGLMFGLHTYRFQIYLSPDRGARGTRPPGVHDPAADLPPATTRLPGTLGP